MSAHEANLDPNSERLRLGPLAGRIMAFGLLIGIASILVSIGIAVIDSGVDGKRFMHSWLTAFIYVLSLALGGLFLVIVYHGLRAGWGVVLRRIAEAVAANLTWIWVLFLPVLVLMVSGHGEVLYHWADPHVADPTNDHYDAIIAGKRPVLNPVFFTIASVIFLGIWVAFGRFMFNNSVAQDATGDVAYTHRMQWWAPLGGLLYAISQSYAIILWVMSLEPHWFSTMYPVYFFAASACGFFAFLIIVVFLLQRWGKVEREITLEHYQDMGKLLFAFGVVFWAYIAFSQYMLIWYANIPEETNWFLTRMLGPWGVVSAILLIGHFIIPFILLVTKHTKRIKPVLAVIAVWMMVLHYIDIYWLVMPEVPAAALEHAATIKELNAIIAEENLHLGFHPHVLDLTLLLGLGGLFVAGIAHRLRACSLVPVQDPRIGESLAFENM